MSEEEIYKMLLVENIDKFPLLNEIFAIRNNRFKKNDYTIYVTGCISLDVINRAIEKVNLIDKLQKENERYKKAIGNGEYTWKQKYEETFGYVKELKEELQKENTELKEKNKEQKKQLESRYYHTINARELEKEINNNWENKIRAEIKELEEYITGKRSSYKHLAIDEALICLHVLKELLGE